MKNSNTTKEATLFILKATAIYALAYLVVGAIAYQFLTKQFYVGDAAIFTSFLRSEADSSLWAHVNQWQIPLLFLRSLLIALVLLPFAKTLAAFSFKKRLAVLFGLVFVLAHFAAAAPSPGNLEGIVYMRPELIDTTTFLLGQPEMIAHSLLFATGVTYILRKHSQ